MRRFKRGVREGERRGGGGGGDACVVVIDGDSD